MASNLSSLSAHKMAARPPRLYKGQWVGMRITIRPTYITRPFSKTYKLTLMLLACLIFVYRVWGLKVEFFSLLFKYTNPKVLFGSGSAHLLSYFIFLISNTVRWLSCLNMNGVLTVFVYLFNLQREQM